MNQSSLSLRTRCPKCNVKMERPIHSEMPEHFECGRCHEKLQLKGKLSDVNQLENCLICNYQYFFVEKDFPRPIAIFIMLIGIALSFFTYGISLIFCGLLDWILYKILPFFRVCYYCKCEYRGYPPDPNLELFDPHKGVAYDARKNAAEYH